jgi:hypothetical protein
VLGRQPERRPARGENGHCRGGREQVGNERGSGEELLEVVQDEQQRATCEVVGDRIDRRPVAALELERLFDSHPEQLRIPERRQVDEARRPLRGQLLGDGECESGLARAAGTGQRDEARLATEERSNSRDFQLPPDERVRRRRQPGGELVELRRSQSLPQDRTVELPQFGRRLDPELVEGGSGGSVRLERVPLATGAVQRNDELAPKRLPVRVLGGERLQLAHDGVVAAEGELGVAQQLDRAQAQLLEPAALGVRNRLGDEVGEARPAPERERLTEPGRSFGRATGGDLTLPTGDEPLEPLEVELARLQADQVAAAARLDPAGAEDLAQPVDVDLQGLHGGGRRLLSPERIDEFVPRNRVPVPQEQGRQ